MICKWCRRLEEEHFRGRCWDEANRIDFADALRGTYLTFTPDLTPTGKLIAAALELGERAKYHDPSEEAEGRAYEPMWIGWADEPLTTDRKITNALIEIHEAENGGGDE